MTTLETTLTLYREGKLTTIDRADLWLAATKFVQSTARKQYHQPQGRGFKYKAGGTQNVSSNPLAGRVVNDQLYEKYMTRMTRFFDFFDSYPDKPIKWVLFIWRRRSPWVEQVIESEVLGISMYPADMPFAKRVTNNVTKKLVECRALLRKAGLLPTDYWYLTEVLNAKHTEKYTKETVNLYKAYIRAALPWLYPELHERSGDV